jgi:hypothetical protein
LSSAEQVNRLVAFLNLLCKIFYQNYQASWNNVLTTRVERTSSALVECLKERDFVTLTDIIMAAFQYAETCDCEYQPV